MTAPIDAERERIHALQDVEGDGRRLREEGELFAAVALTSPNGALEGTYRDKLAVLESLYPRELVHAEFHAGMRARLETFRGGLEKLAGFSAAPVRLRWHTALEICAAEPDEPEYVAPPYHARGCITQMDAAPKEGKTTYGIGVAGAVVTGERFLGQETERCPVLYLTEEGPRSFSAALRHQGLAESRDLHVLYHFEACTRPWPETAESVRRQAADIGAGFLVLDTLGPWTLAPGVDENDAGAAEVALRPLRAIANDNLTVLILRHTRKSGGSLAEAARGSSAFAGAVEALVSLRQMPGSGHPNRRELRARARAGLDLPESLVIELEGNRFVTVGSGADVERQAARQRLLDVLPLTRETALTLDSLADKADVRRTPCSNLLVLLQRDGIVRRDKGAGEASPRGDGWWMADDD